LPDDGPAMMALSEAKKFTLKQKQGYNNTWIKLVNKGFKILIRNFQFITKLFEN